MLKRILKNQKGLTLIELLAVIVILGIIAAIAVPSIGGIIDKARNDAAHAEALQVLNAAKLYVAGEDPASGTLSKTSPTSTGGLDEYIDNIDVYSITITKNSDGTYTYSAISVTTEGKSLYYADEDDLLAGTTSPKP